MRLYEVVLQEIPKLEQLQPIMKPGISVLDILTYLKRGGSNVQRCVRLEYESIPSIRCRDINIDVNAGKVNICTISYKLGLGCRDICAELYNDGVWVCKIRVMGFRRSDILKV